jgi:hypothetical protein
MGVSADRRMAETLISLIRRFAHSPIRRFAYSLRRALNLEDDEDENECRLSRLA